MNTNKKKLIIFDLDDTIIMWNMSGHERIVYDYELENFLKKLKEKNFILTIASFNDYADKFLNRMGLDDYFTYIVGSSSFDSKIYLIENIMNKFPTIKKEEILFFDDLESNCNDVSDGCKIDSIKVCPITGIEFQQFYNTLDC